MERTKNEYVLRAVGQRAALGVYAGGSMNEPMPEETIPLECYGGPWDGRLATTVEAFSFKGFRNGHYTLVSYYHSDNPKGGTVKALEWYPMEWLGIKGPTEGPTDAGSIGKVK